MDPLSTATNGGALLQTTSSPGSGGRAQKQIYREVSLQLFSRQPCFDEDNNDEVSLEASEWEPDPASRLAVLPVIGPLWRGVERFAPPVCVEPAAWQTST